MWEQIRSNRIRSVVLITGMGILLILLGYFLGFYFLDSPTGGVIIALVVWGVMNLVAYFQGDNILLSVSGARKITRDDHPRLYNIVEEMTLASGLPKIPDIYIIDDSAMNAFATGRSPEKAAVAITSGLLEKLNRDELQGVIGHEISHIKNRDILVMSLAGVILGTVVILAWYATRMLFFSSMTGGRRSSRSDGGQGQIIILVFGIVLMILAPIAAQLLYLAVSRKREYLADASAALYTRYPEGLASALEKLAASTQELQKANKATAPMYIINPFRKKGMAAEDISSTHPPLSRRIHILRSMGGASLADYNRSYLAETGAGVIPASALTEGGSLALRPATAGKRDEIGEQVERKRETSDLMYRLEKYRTVSCPCGTQLRVPAGYKDSSVKCPHCGRIHQV